MRARLLDLGVRAVSRGVGASASRCTRACATGASPIRGSSSSTRRWSRSAGRPSARTSSSQREELARRGVDLVEIERGGDVTYHGPGQLVVYPIRKLERFREVVPLVRALEAAVINVCARFGVAANAGANTPASGSSATRSARSASPFAQMVSLHGIALNVSTRARLRSPHQPVRPDAIAASRRSRPRPGRTIEHRRTPSACLLDELARTFDVEFMPVLVRRSVAARRST